MPFRRYPGGHAQAVMDGVTAIHEIGRLDSPKTRHSWGRRQAGMNARLSEPADLKDIAGSAGQK